MKTFAEYCKDMDNQNISEFFGLFNKAVKCPVCGSNLEIDNSPTIDYTGKNNKKYKCTHCDQDYSLDAKTGVLDKIYGVNIH